MVNHVVTADKLPCHFLGILPMIEPTKAIIHQHQASSVESIQKQRNHALEPHLPRKTTKREQSYRKKPTTVDQSPYKSKKGGVKTIQQLLRHSQAQGRAKVTMRLNNDSVGSLRQGADSRESLGAYASRSKKTSGVYTGKNSLYKKENHSVEEINRNK